jgi:hypothetical protein
MASFYFDTTCKRKLKQEAQLKSMQQAQQRDIDHRELGNTNIVWPPSIDGVNGEVVNIVEKYQAALKSQDQAQLEAGCEQDDEAELQSESSMRDKKTLHKRKKTSIPRPPNSFFVFRRLRYAELREQVKGKDNRDVSCDIGLEWKRLGKQGQEIYKEAAEVLKWEHAAKYPLYKYRPQRPAEKKQKKKYRKMVRRTSLASQPCIQVSQASEKELTDADFSLLYQENAWPKDLDHLHSTLSLPKSNSSETLFTSFEDYFSLPPLSNQPSPDLTSLIVPDVISHTFDQVASAPAPAAWLFLPAYSAFERNDSPPAAQFYPNYVYKHSIPEEPEPEQSIPDAHSHGIEPDTLLQHFFPADVLLPSPTPPSASHHSLYDSL